MMIKKVSLVALCAVSLFAGKVFAEEQAKQEEAAPVEQEKPTAAGGSFEDILESPKIKELLAQENIDWDAVMKALGDMDFNLGVDEDEDSHSHDHHGHDHHHGHSHLDDDSSEFENMKVEV